MKKSLQLLLLIFSLSSFQSRAQFNPTDSSWKMVFVDDFDAIDTTFQLDTAKWDYRMPWYQNTSLRLCHCDTICHDTLIGISCYTNYTDTNNFKIDTTGSGTLKIKARKGNYHGQSWTWHYPCDSTCDGTCNTADSTCFRSDSAWYDYSDGLLRSVKRFKYGYFEMKFRIPAVPVAPANYGGFTTDWWMWGSEHPTGISSEIDMFEIRNRDNEHTENVHFLPPYSNVDEAGIFDLHGSIDSTWHISALDWEPDKIDFYLDGVKIHSYPFKPDSMVAMPMILSLDLAQNFCDKVDSNTLFLFVFEIDYVKVYQLNLNCSADTTITTYIPSTYDFAIHKTITLGGPGAITTMPDSTNFAFRATDSITLTDGFIWDGKSDILFNVQTCQADQYYGYRLFGPVIDIYPPPPDFISRMFYHF